MAVQPTIKVWVISCSSWFNWGYLFDMWTSAFQRIFSIPDTQQCGSISGIDERMQRRMISALLIWNALLSGLGLNYWRRQNKAAESPCRRLTAWGKQQEEAAVRHNARVIAQVKTIQRQRAWGRKVTQRGELRLLLDNSLRASLLVSFGTSSAWSYFPVCVTGRSPK